MLIEVKSKLRVADTLVPLIFMSDRTQLLNVSGNKTEWPVYISIGNQSWKIDQIPSMHSFGIVAVQLIPIKKHNIPQKWLDEQRQWNLVVLNEAIQWVHQPLRFENNPSTQSGYYDVPCADGNIRCCKPVVAAWLEDCPEYSNLHRLERHVCVCHSKMEIGPDATYKPPRHSGRPHQYFQVRPDAPRPPWSYAKWSQTLQKNYQVLQKAPAVMKVYSGCYDIWLFG